MYTPSQSSHPMIALWPVVACSFVAGLAAGPCSSSAGNTTPVAWNRSSVLFPVPKQPCEAEAFPALPFPTASREINALTECTWRMNKGQKQSWKQFFVLCDKKCQAKPQWSLPQIRFALGLPPPHNLDQPKYHVKNEQANWFSQCMPYIFLIHSLVIAHPSSKECGAMASPAPFYPCEVGGEEDPKVNLISWKLRKRGQNRVSWEKRLQKNWSLPQHNVFSDHFAQLVVCKY